MRYAIIGTERREAEPGLLGECLACCKAMIPKCGKHRVHHWAHQGKRSCDPWWEHETEWHRTWKNHFPKGWQEFVQHSESGERHIADVKTDLGSVIEFQHSFLCEDERESRETFHQRMVWVVDGLRRMRDRAQFFAALEAGTGICREPLIVLIPWKNGALLRDWGESRVPVYVDFGISILWRLNPSHPRGMTCLTPVPKAEFLRVHLEGEPFEETCTSVLAEAAARHAIQQGSQPLTPFDRYLAMRQRTRPRF